MGVRVDDPNDRMCLTPLHLAAAGGHVAAIELLLRAGAKVGVKDKSRRNTPLHWAAQSSHAPAVKALLRGRAWGRAKLEAKNIKGQTPLHLAVIGGDLATVEALLEAGANARARTAKYPRYESGGRSHRPQQRRSPIMFANYRQQEKSQQFQQLLIRYGADPLDIGK